MGCTSGVVSGITEARELVEAFCRVVDGRRVSIPFGIEGPFHDPEGRVPVTVVLGSFPSDEDGLGLRIDFYPPPHLSCDLLDGCAVFLIPQRGDREGDISVVVEGSVVKIPTNGRVVINGLLAGDYQVVFNSDATCL